MRVSPLNQGSYRFPDITRGAGSAGLFLVPVLMVLLLFRPADVTASSDADDLLVVDCLLPGQVRQLGRKTYLAARRPVKTTARDCRIRGGEYVAYDRASYATALQVWLPQAREGDVEASVNVGEIYEKGLGLEPDYPAAAHWYRLAAEQGSARAQINLGHLYETGLGVDRDPAMALQWYRRASGITGPLVLDPGTIDIPAGVAESAQNLVNDEFLGEVERLRNESDTLQNELEMTRQQLDEARRELDRQAATTEPAAETAPVAREVSPEQARIRTELENRKKELERLKAELGRHRSQEGSLQSHLAAADDQLATLRTELEQNRRAAEARRAELQQARAALGEYEQSASADRSEVARLRQLWEQRVADSNRQQAEIQRLQAALERLEGEAAGYRERLAEQDAYQAAIRQGSLAGPSITMIDPQVSHTRSAPATVIMRGDAQTRQIVGRLEAPAGLLSLTVNDRNGTVNEQGVFLINIARDKPKIPVSVVAIDRQGKRDTVDFILEAEPEARAQSRSVAQTGVAQSLPPVEFGNYHALVIGIDAYRSLPKLQTAVSDAKAVSEVLQKRYGFQVTTLLNASRYDILSALNDLRQRLTTDDNLLIYYAGHGELDRVNMRGQWLPVDAELDNTANWLSNVAVTDILNIINARQILVVVDSCYSGSLTRSALTYTEGSLTEQERLSWLKSMAKKRSRTVLTSGGLEPTLDEGGGGHSVFANALLAVLSSNNELLDGRHLYQEVSARVAYAASRIRFEQVPEYAPIQHTGHEGGDFFLVPVL